MQFDDPAAPEGPDRGTLPRNEAPWALKCCYAPPMWFNVLYAVCACKQHLFRLIVLTPRFTWEELGGQR